MKNYKLNNAGTTPSTCSRSVANGAYGAKGSVTYTATVTVSRALIKAALAATGGWQSHS